MNPTQKEAFIRRVAAKNRVDSDLRFVLWSRHAITKAVRESLSREEVESALEQSEVIEDYEATNRPSPNCLVIGKVSIDEPVHAVVAIDEFNDRIFIVTVYRPLESKWQNDWKTRR